jgi:amino acid adenylation domain-containing protein
MGPETDGMAGVVKSLESTTDRPRSFLIGNTSLLINCCDLLLLNKWAVLGIISSDPGVIDYANKNNIALKDESVPLTNFLSEVSFEYLFSIVNEVILDKTILNLPLKLAVNYHDSLLPKGAGVYSTTWAILNGEQVHGISWHIIDEGIDTGDLLVQKKIRIEKFESSFSLNLKCYQAAIESFSVLLTGLENGTLIPVKQDLAGRTYFPLKKRPYNLGMLNFSDQENCQQTILSALDFGEMPDNKFCTPKIFLGNKFFIIRDFRFKRSRENTPIGCIGEATSKGIDICLGNGKTLTILSMTTLEGEKWELNTLAEDFNLIPGKMLPFPDQSYLSRLRVLYEQLIGKEDYWVRKLSGLNLVRFPFVSKEKPGNESFSTAKFELNEDLLRYCQQINNDGIDLNLFSLLLMYISRLTDTIEFDIWFRVNSAYSKYPNLFSPYVPLGCKIEKTASAAENLVLINKQISETRRKETFILDIYTRIKLLKELDIKSVAGKVPFFIGQIDNPEEFEPLVPFDWGILISLNTRSLNLVYKENEGNGLVAEKFFHHFSVFSQNSIAHKGIGYREVPLLTESEKNKKLFEWNRQKISFPENVCIHELVEMWAVKTPGETAIVLFDEKLSYSELDQNATKIAAYLIDHGIGRGDKVGVMIERSIYAIVSFLGILKTGAAYVPLDINLPASRLKYMLDDSEIKMLIAGDSTGNSSGTIKTGIYSEIIDKAVIQPAAMPKVNSNDLAYIKYTSGSTGQPKGVLITHKNVVGFLYSYRRVINVSERRIGTCVAPLNFDTSVEEVYSCLCFGGTVHIMMKEQSTDLDYFARYLADKKINVSYIIPEFIEGVGKYLKNEGEVYLKTLLTGLYAKRNNVFKPFFELAAPVRVLNGYGPTEVTYGSNAYQVMGNEDPFENTPIGRPFPNYQTYVVDSTMQLLPDFIPGELLIGGIGLSQGYINKPEITRLKFVAFETEDFRTPVYKTGDVVYSMPSGDLQFVGRNDDQVKISGYRIEISEIEEALKSHESIATAIVVKRKGKKDHDQLTAYLVLKKKMEDAELHKFLEDRIPGYMIPAFIVPVDSIPVFPNGKINYALLPEPYYHKKSTSTNSKKPENPTEEKIKQIFEDQLDIEEIGVEDNFFDIGGDSITAVHIMQQVENEFGRKIPISMLYKYASIRKLANEIEKQKSESTYSSIIPIREEGDQKPVFFIHTIGGAALTYSNIIKNLEEGHPVYGIQARYSDDIDIRHDGIEKISGLYVKDILRMSKQECILIGYSFGGIIAFEMARQMNSLGYNACLIILDTRMAGIFSRMFPDKYQIIRIFDWLRWAFPYFFKSMYAIFKRRDFRNLYGSVRLTLYEMIRNLPELWRTAPLQESGQPDILGDKVNKHQKMVEKYCPGIYHGNLFLIQGKGENEKGLVNKTRTNFFRQFVTGQIFKKQVNTSHKNIFNSPYVEEVTGMINSFLQSDQEG